jgi:hypothetical protein
MTARAACKMCRFVTHVPLRDPELVKIQFGKTNCGDAVWCIVLGKGNSNSYTVQLLCLSNCLERIGNFVDRGLVNTENKSMVNMRASLLETGGVP